MVELTESPIDLLRLLADVTHPECGAEVLFVGTTRQWTDGVETGFLEYDGYREMAMKQLEALEAEARQRWPIHAVAMVHRLGRVDVGQPSVAVAVGSPHRGEAFEAARWLIDELKRQVPIWKREHFTNQQQQWIHPNWKSCQCGHTVTAVTPSPPSQSQQPQQQQ